MTQTIAALVVIGSITTFTAITAFAHPRRPKP